MVQATQVMEVSAVPPEATEKRVLSFDLINVGVCGNTELPDTDVVTAPAIVAVPDMEMTFPETLVTDASPLFVKRGIRTPELVAGIGAQFRPL